MNIRTYTLCLTFAILSLVLTAADSAVAAEGSVLDDPRVDTRATRNSLQESSVNNLSSQQPRVSRRQAMNLASGRYEGRVLGVVQVDNNNYRVRMDRDGTVFNVFVNASSGAVSASSD